MTDNCTLGLGNSRVLRPGRSYYLWGGYCNIGNYPAALKACGLYFSQTIIWDKGHPVLTPQRFHGRMNGPFTAGGKATPTSFSDPTNATDLWRVKKVNPQNMVHLTEKPVELAVRALQYSSRPAENVLDLFAAAARR